MQIQTFNIWNLLKQKIHFWNNKEFFVKPKQIWYVHNWINVWFETNGKWNDFKRPVLVLKKVWNVFFVAPMSTKWKDDNKFYYKLDDSYFNKPSYILLSQIKIIDKKRFFEEIWEISWEDFRNIKNKLKDLLF